MTINLLKKKVCIDCKTEYQPTSNVQKRCPECIKKYKKEYASKYKKTETKAFPWQENKKPDFTAAEDSIVLKMLVMTGVVTDEKVDMARKIIQTMRA